jgi:hypothetical protein
MEGVLFLVIAAIAIVACIVYILAKNYDNPDINNDGVLDFKDVTAAATKVKEEVIEKAVEVKAKVAEKVKVVADVNKDGKVDLKDAAAAATKVKDKVKEEVKEQASKVNKNLRNRKKK